MFSGKIKGSLSRSLLIKWMLTFFIIMIGCTGVVRVFAVSSDDVRLDKKVVVVSGDTLWQIALTHKPEGMDTRAYINLIKRSNGMSSSSVNAGEVLILPQFK
ncbi:LysM peptidoglycan-binding domain-containing protein [Paenibacillus pini]|nr:LysM peptidoglycan-binding domain-containing protein [Paenibacillus pini]